MSALSIEDVCVSYGGVRVVDEVTLSIPKGTTVGLVGASGCGKSTLARAIVGLVPITSGKIAIDGSPVARFSRTRRFRHDRRVQMIFQDPYTSLDPRMAVGDSVGEALRHSTASRAERRARVEEYLSLVSLDPSLAAARPGQLSGGQLQRVAIARALCADPDVIVADEITSSLDVSVQAAILNLMRRLKDEVGLTMLFISHNLAVVRYMADEIAVMNDGRIVERAPTDELISSAQDPFTKELLGAIPVGFRPAAPA